MARTTPTVTQAVVLPDPELVLMRHRPTPRVETALVLVRVRIPTSTREVIDHLEISDAVKQAFHRRPRWVTDTEYERIALAEEWFASVTVLADELGLLADGIGMITEGAAES